MFVKTLCVVVAISLTLSLLAVKATNVASNAPAVDQPGAGSYALVPPSVDEALERLAVADRP